MGQYLRIKCPTCSASIELGPNDLAPEYCPACKEYLRDKLARSGDGTGINTATATGPGLHPLSSLIEDVY